MKRPTRAASRKMWGRVAAGELDDAEVRAWLARVAAAVLAADDTVDRPDGKDRIGAIVQAVGLQGRKKDTDAERWAIRTMKEIFDTAGSVENPAGAKLTPRQALRVSVARRVGVDPSTLGDKYVRERIDQRIREALKDAE